MRGVQGWSSRGFGVLEWSQMEGRMEIKEKSSLQLEPLRKEKYIYRERKRRKLEEEVSLGGLRGSFINMY